MRPSRSHSDTVVELVDVVLVEEEVPDEFLLLLREIAEEAIAARATWPGEPRYDWHRPAGGPTETASGPARRPRRRHVVRWTVVAAVVVAVIVVVPVVGAHQAAARLAALQELPAVLDPLTGPPTETWRAVGPLLAAEADLLVVGAADGSVSRLDPQTGAASWSVPVGTPGPARCFTVDESLRPDRVAVGPAPAGNGWLACVPDTSGPGVPGEGAVVVLDRATGQEQLRLTLGGVLVDAAPVGRDLLVVAATADGTVGLARWDLAAAQALWRAGLPPPTGVAEVELRESSVGLGGRYLDLLTGRPVERTDAEREPLDRTEHVLPDGDRVSWWWRGDGGSGQGKVVRADGRPVPLLGPPVVPAVTDGSFPSSLLVTSARGDRLGSLDLRSGRNLWLRPAPGSSTLTATAQVGGVALLEHDTSVTAVDVRLGANRWRAAVEPGVATGALTDGEVVVLPEPASDGTLMLVARDVADGAERWRVPAPAGTTTLAVVAHQLVAATGDVVVGLG